MSIHFYNLDGRHFFSSVLPSTSNHRITIAGVLQPNNPSSINVSRTEVDVELESAMPYSAIGSDIRGGCFSFGPLAGIYLIAPGTAHPLIKPHEVAQLWMATMHGLREECAA